MNAHQRQLATVIMFLLDYHYEKSREAIIDELAEFHKQHPDATEEQINKRIDELICVKVPQSIRHDPNIPKNLKNFMLKHKFGK